MNPARIVLGVSESRRENAKHVCAHARLPLVAPALRLKRLGDEILRRAASLDRHELGPLPQRTLA
jgi:hypothetical protein